MTIEYRCDTCRADDANDACFGKCHNKEEMIDLFEQFLDNHGTGCDDYDEFHCKFIEEVK